MASTATLKRKPRTAAPPAPKEEPTPETKGQTSGLETIETDLIKVVFVGTQITFLLKKTGETHSKDYGGDTPDKQKRGRHALTIIHGRLLKNPHGDYLKQCIGRIRTDTMRHDVVL
jgi:hypothetical protein